MTDQQNQNPAKPEPRFKVVAIRRNSGEEHGYIIDICEESTEIILTGIRVYWDNHEGCGEMDLPRHELSKVEVPETVQTFACYVPWFFEKLLTAMGEFAAGVQNLVKFIENDGTTPEQLEVKPEEPGSNSD